MRQQFLRASTLVVNIIVDIMFTIINIVNTKTNTEITLMSPLEKRAWLTLCSMCPVYLVYFTIRLGFPDVMTTMRQRLGLLAVVASLHAVSYLAGWLVMKRREAGENLLEDERDHAIDRHAARIGYFVLLTGIILVGMVMPFNKSGWELVNAALFFIVLTETLRNALIVLGYRRSRHAH